MYGRYLKLAPILPWLILIRLSLVRAWRLVCGGDLAFSPRSKLCHQREGRRSVQSGCLLTLVAELDCPWRQHIGLGKLARRFDVVFLDQADEVAQRVARHERHPASGQHGLDQLLGGLLCVKPTIASATSASEQTFRTSVSSSTALASSTRAKSSRSCGGMQHSTLGQRGMHHRPLHGSPVLGVALADDDHIERHPERA